MPDNPTAIDSTVYRPAPSGKGDKPSRGVASQRRQEPGKFGLAQVNTTSSVFAPMQLERKVLLVLLPPLALACIAAWASGIVFGKVTFVEEYQLPPMAALFGFLFLWALRSRANEIWKIRGISLTVVCFVAFERLALGLWLTAQDGYDPAILRNMLPWIILASLMWIFLLPGNNGVYGALVNYAVNAAAVLAFVAFNRQPFDSTAAADLVLTYVVAHLLLIGITVVFSRLRVAYGKALARAEDLEVLALEDALTGVLNRRAFSLAFKRVRARFLRNQTPVSVMLLDIDYFKSVNDTLGHDVGDHALRALAGLLVSDLRRTDEVFRCGGEEFLILLDETALQLAWDIAERLRKKISKANLIHNRVITVSIGVAELAQHESEVDIFKRADIALYQAKNKGRDQVCLAYPPQDRTDIDLR
jgi:diguanylate cyclase (GGDEF)-like protein